MLDKARIPAALLEKANKKEISEGKGKDGEEY